MFIVEEQLVAIRKHGENETGEENTPHKSKAYSKHTPCKTEKGI